MNTLAIASGVKLYGSNAYLAYANDRSIVRTSFLSLCNFVLKLYLKLIGLGGVFLLFWLLSTPFTRTTVQKLPVPADARSKHKHAQASLTVHTPDPVKYLATTIAIALAAIQVVFPATLYPLSEPYTHPVHPVRILSSIPSITGVIVVGEVLPLPRTSGPEANTSDPHYLIQDMRYLRASHSLLGGVWIGEKTGTLDHGTVTAQDSEGNLLGDSIYSAFVLQEAVLLAEGREPNNALTM